jgi:hypothetical protein
MLNPNTLLSNLPAGLRDPLFAAYREIATNFAEHRWEPSELNGGKLCEIVYTIVDGATSGTFAASPSKPANFVDACKAVEQRPSVAARPGDRSLRILIPRQLPFLYEIRNNRGVGHVGGDVNPNHSDATIVLASANWLMAELVRIFHGVTLEEAQEAADALVERTHPIVWEIGDVKRVLDPSLSKSDQTLLLLYSSPGWVGVKDLQKWVEYQNPSNFKDRVLAPLHDDRSIEYDREKGCTRLTPRGGKLVEETILPKYKAT